MKYLAVDMDGSGVLLKTPQPAEEDLKAVYNGNAYIFQLEVNEQGDIQVRWPDITLNSAEGEEEEDEYEVEWKLVT